MRIPHGFALNVHIFQLGAGVDHRHARRAFSFVLISVHLFKNHCSLNAVTTHQALAATVGGGNRVQAVAFSSLLVDDVFQLRQVAGTCTDKLFFQRHLEQHTGMRCPMPLSKKILFVMCP